MLDRQPCRPTIGKYSVELTNSIRRQDQNNITDTGKKVPCLGYEARGAGSGARDWVDHDQVAAEKLKVTKQYILGPDIMDLKCD